MDSAVTRFFSPHFWLQLFNSLIQTFQRFPLVFIALIAINAIFVDEIHDINLLSDQQARNTLLALVGGAFWFTAARLLSESLAWKKYRFYLLALPVFILFSWYCTTQDTWQWDSVLPVFSAALAISFAPWLFRQKDNASFWYFNYQLINALCFAILSALILCGGISLIFVSIDYLFEIDIDSELYQDTWLFGMALLAPIYFLAHIPKQFDYQRSECEFPIGLRFIFTYVLVPLSLIYMVILYAYFTKILLQWELPRGHLGKMISAFGVIGIISHIAIYPIHDRSSALIAWFYRHFYLMMIAPLLLLLFAIGERILQYGVTEPRYLVALCALLFVVLVISFIKNRQQFKLQHVVTTLALLSLIASFGPWGIKQLPINSQYARLETTLIQHGYLADGKIQNTEQADFKTRKSISSMVDFLVQHNAGNKLRPWFNDVQNFDEKLDCDDYHSCEYFNGRVIVELMGIQYVSQWDISDNVGKWTNVSIASLDNPNTIRMLNVTDANFSIPLEWLMPNSAITASTVNSSGDDVIFNVMVNEQNQLEVSTLAGDKISFDLVTIAKQFPENETIQIGVEDIDKLIHTSNGNNFKGTLYIDQLHFIYLDDAIEVNSLNGTILISMP